LEGKVLDGDELPMDEVGPWVKDKHDRLRKYVDISRAARRKWVEGSSRCATYVDLFCGSGRALIRDSGETVDGSPLVAFKSARDGGVPFSEIHLADAAEDRCKAAEQRIHSAGGSATSYVGTADQTAVRIAKRLNRYGLHFVFLDPYNLQDLPFSVIKAFSGLKYVDILIHVSAQDLQRNLDAYATSEDGPLDTFAPGWRKAVDLKRGKQATRAAFIAYWASQIEALGLPPAQRAELVSGPTKNQRLYWLVFVSRSDFAKGLWDKIRNLSGQGELL
jgi:three-Cys-motif partner protein